MGEILTMHWSGPHRWPKGGRQPREEALEQGGVYVFSVEHPQGYLVYCAGHTQHFRKRFRQHDRCYWNGTYSIFDHSAFAAGKRVKVWPGFWFRKHQPLQLLEDYEARKAEILAATKRWLDGYRVFVAPIDAGKRIRQRIESALMQAFMEAEPPACDMPDQGMSLSSRWPWEEPLAVEKRYHNRILGMPAKMVI